MISISNIYFESSASQERTSGRYLSVSLFLFDTTQKQSWNFIFRQEKLILVPIRPPHLHLL